MNRRIGIAKQCDDPQNLYSVSSQWELILQSVGVLWGGEVKIPGLSPHP